MKPPKGNRPERKRPAPATGTDAGGRRPERFRGRDFRIDATPEQLAAVIGAGPAKAPHEWKYLKRKPVQSDSEEQPRRRSKSSAKQSG